VPNARRRTGRVLLFAVAILALVLPSGVIGGFGDSGRGSAPIALPAPSLHLALAAGERGQASRAASIDGRPLASNLSSNSSAWWPCPLCGPAPRANFSLVTDSRKGDLLLEGGFSRAGGYLPDAWTFQNGRWVESFEYPNLGRRQGAAAAFDPVDNQSVFFGGLYGWDYSDTWLVNGTNWSQQACGSTCPPPARFGASMVYDAHDHYLLLFGGRACVDFSCPLNSTLFNDSWKYQGGAWSQLSPPVSPPARAWASMVYDARDGYVVLQGGESGTLLSDTWTFQGGTWTDVTSVVGAGPGPRAFSGATYDPIRDRVLLFGGLSPLGPTNDLWQFAGAAWNPVPLAAGPIPVARTGAGFAYDPSSGGLLLLGGVGVGGNRNPGATWELRGDRWVSSPAQPSPFNGQVITYDAHDHEDLLFGGGTIGLLGNATYVFDNGTWNDISNQSATAPGPRFSTQIAYDARDGYAVLFGGYGCFNPGCGGIFNQGPLNDTWTFSAGRWTHLSTPVAPPTTESQSAAMGYDSTDGVVVLLTACSCSVSTYIPETWTFTGGVWTNVTSRQTVQPLVGEASMADSPSDQGVVLFGGQGTNSTWLFSNGTWSNITASAGSAPASRYGAAFTADSTLGSPILFGGILQPVCSTCLPTANDTWEFQQGHWLKLSGGWAPFPRYTAQAADDPADGGIVLWGMSGGEDASDTWTFGPAPELSVDVHVAPTTTDASLGVQLFSGVSGGVPPYMINWTSGTRSLGSSPNLVERFGTPVRYSVGLNVSDDSNSSVNGSAVVVLVDNLSVTAAASAAHTVAGVAVNFTGSSSGGVGPFLPIWRFGDGTWSANPNATHAYPTAGSYVAWFWTNDSVGASSGIPIGLNVTPALTLAVTASAQVTDVGVAVRFNASAFGGVPPISVSWNFGDGAMATGPFVAHPFSTSGVHQVNAWANDTVGGSVRVSTTVTVNPAPTVMLEINGILDLGQTLSLAAIAGNGTGALVYQWSGLPTGCSSTPIPQFSCVPSTAGEFHPVVTVTDTVGVIASSAPTIVTIFPKVSGTLQLSSAVIDQGQTTTLFTNISGGAPPVTVSYSGVPAGCGVPRPSPLTCIPSEIGKSMIRAQLRDATGASANPAPVSLTVNPTLHGSLSAWPRSLVVGENVTIEVNASGGTAPLQYTYSGLPDGCGPITGARVDCTPARSGNYSVSVVVVDEAKATLSFNTTIEVTAPPAAPPASGGSSLTLYVVVGGIAVALGVAALAIVAVSRRRKARERAEEPGESEVAGR
jgi:hypothetical protein